MDFNTPSDWFALFPDPDRRLELANGLERAVKQHGLTRAADLAVALSLRYRMAYHCPIAPQAERDFAYAVVQRLRTHRALALATFAPFLALRPKANQRRRAA